MTLLKFSVGYVVKAVAYVKKTHIDIIVATVNEVLASGTLTNITESNVIKGDILSLVTAMNKQGQHKSNSNDLHQLSMNDLQS